MKKPERIVWVWSLPGDDYGRWTTEKATQLAIPYAPVNEEREAAVRELRKEAAITTAYASANGHRLVGLGRALAKLAALDKADSDE